MGFLDFLTDPISDLQKEVDKGIKGLQKGTQSIVSDVQRDFIGSPIKALTGIDLEPAAVQSQDKSLLQQAADVQGDLLQTGLKNLGEGVGGAIGGAGEGVGSGIGDAAKGILGGLGISGKTLLIVGAGAVVLLVVMKT